MARPSGDLEYMNGDLDLGLSIIYDQRPLCMRIPLWKRQQSLLKIFRSKMVPI